MSVLSKLDNVKISYKFTSVLALMFLPIILLNYIIITEKQVLIDFAEKEVAGVKYLRATHQALVAVTKPAPSIAEIAAASAMIKKADQEDTSFDVEKAMQETVAELDKGAGINLSAAADKIMALITEVSDGSNITLDPDFNSYYVGDTIVNQGPSYVNRLMDVMEEAKELGNLSTGAVTPEMDNDYTVAVSQMAAYAESLANDINKAMTQDPDGNIKGNLSGILAQIQGQQTIVLAAAKTKDTNAIGSSAARMNLLVQQFLVKSSDTMEELLNERLAGFQKDIVRSLGIAGILVLLSVLLAIVIIRGITKPLGNITGLMGRLTAGELTIEVPKMSRGDEIGVLNQSLQAMHESAIARQRAQVEESQRLAKEGKRAELIQNTIQQFESKIQGIVSTVAAAATELAHTAQQMTKIMKAASDNTSNAVATASETAGNVSSVAAAAEEMAASVREISSQVQKTNELVKDSQSKTIAADEKANALSDASAKVRDAVMLISTISSKINLLALNATIESARAGEAGRGFAVVASEVKVLANQTNQSLEDIGKVIEGMDSASSEITKALTNIKDSVEQVSSASNSIAAAVEEQSATTNEITRNMQNAAQGTNLISENLGTVSQSSGEATSAANEVLSAAEELSRQAESLNREVNDFLEVIKAA